MTDKEKIREEVERLMDELIQEKEKVFGSDVDDACILELQNVLTYIDSLQAEPTSRTPADVESAMQEVDEKSRAFTEAHQGEDTDTILAQMRGEEPVSENLEEAAKNYGIRQGVELKPFAIKYFKAGAKWQNNNLWKDVQKELVSKDLEKASIIHSEIVRNTSFIDEDFIAGAVWQKEQLMKDAIPAELYSDGMLTPLIGVKDKEKLKGIKFGDKVKLIIIKDEQL